MDLEKHSISRKGFLPEKCLTTAPIPFESLNYILEVVHTLDIFTFRKLANRSIPDENKIVSYFANSPKREELEFLYSKLSIIIHKYLWGNYKEDPNDSTIKDKSIREVQQMIIPKHLGYSWLKASELLGIKPALTHAAVDLYNWCLIDETKPFCLDNLKSIALMTNSPSEEWFYLVMVAIEGECADSIRIMENINNLIKSPQQNQDIDKSLLILKLNSLNEYLIKGYTIISRMYEKCEPHHFYNVLRIFLGGYSDKNVFPDGLKVDTYNGIVKIDSKGGSAAQSSLIPLWDAFLGVEHLGHSKEFLMEMRQYMPESHRNYIEDFEKRCNLLSYVKRNRDQDIIDAYNRCLNSVTEFRKRHLKIVHDFIIKMIKVDNLHGEKGTGGTELKTFLSGLIGNVTIRINMVRELSQNNTTLFEWIIYKLEDVFGVKSTIFVDGLTGWLDWWLGLFKHRKN